MIPHNKLTDGEPLAREKFFSPAREFGIMPFWFWNGEMDYAEMEYQLREYHAKGIPAIYIHARFGVNEHVPYISEDWFDRVKFTIEKAQEIGLQVWVYDEYNWPSGTAGQSIMRDKPRLTNRYLELVEDNIPGQYFTFMEGTDSRYHDLEQSEPVYACAILQKDLDAGNPAFIDLMPSLSFDKVISWEAPPGPWKLFFFIERQASWYADVLNEETTREFLARTHERYKAAVGSQHFGEKVRGFYTDEPAMHYFEIFKNNNTLPWSAQMFKIFRQRKGYDLKPLLPMLYYNVGTRTEQVRYDYFSALSDQYEDAYYRQISNWCHANDTNFTGHLLCEESIRLHARTGGNLFHMLRHLDMTGVDHLYPRVGTREMPSEHVALKIASSAAHQNGSTRLLCESMGGLYWDCTMERMKWVADWEYVLGVNVLNPHGFHYSIEGSRKRDWPPSQFYHHTWWPEYADFNTYMSRLGYTLSGGRHVAKLAVLYPINTVWATYTPQAPTPVGALIEAEFPYLADRLLRIHTDYDYLDEDVLAGCELRGAKLCIREEEYEALVLPAMTHIKASTLDVLERFVAAGGKVLADTLLPMQCVEGDAPDFEARVEALFGARPGAVREAYERGEDVPFALRQINRGAGLCLFAQGRGFAAEGDLETLRDAVLRMVEPEIAIDSEEIFYLHRVKDGEELFFLVNPTDGAVDAQITLCGRFAPESWDLENGGITPLHLYTVDEKQTTFAMHFEPYGSALISAAPYTGQPHLEEANFTVLSFDGKNVRGCGGPQEKRAVAVCDGERQVCTMSVPGAAQTLTLPAQWAFETDKPNCILTDAYKMRYVEPGEGADAAREICAPDYDFAGWYDFKMGAWEMQLPMERDENTYPVDLWYAARFAADYVPADAVLLVDGFAGSGWQLYVNGACVDGPFTRSWLDAEIRQVPVGALLRRGENTVAVKLTVTKKSDGMLDLLKITGNFCVELHGGKPVITAPGHQLPLGDWTQLGYPYYSGAGVYTGAFTLPPQAGECRVTLTGEVGADILEASANGGALQKRLWRPYAVDLTQQVHPGENSLRVRCVNTLVNLLEGKTQASGVRRLQLQAQPVFTMEF